MRVVNNMFFAFGNDDAVYCLLSCQIYRRHVEVVSSHLPKENAKYNVGPVRVMGPLEMAKNKWLSLGL